MDLFILIIILIVVWWIFSAIINFIKEVVGGILYGLMMVILYLIPFALAFFFSYYSLQQFNIKPIVTIIISAVSALFTHISKRGSEFTISSSIIYFLGILILKIFPNIPSWVCFPYTIVGMFIVQPMIMNWNDRIIEDIEELERVFSFSEELTFFDVVSYILSTALLLLWCFTVMGFFGLG